MDSEGPMSSVGRNFWTVWSYITGAISRFFRPEAVNNFTNDPNTFQESAVDHESAACGQIEKEDSKMEVTEDQPLTTLNVPIVAWELCSSESCGEPDVVDTQYKTQLTENQDNTSVTAEEPREGHQAQTELFDPEDGQQNGDRILGLYTGGQGQHQRNAVCVNRLFDSKGDTDAEEAAASALTEGDRQRMDETAIKCKTEGEDDTMSCEGKKKGEYTDEKWLQRHEDVVFLASINEGEINQFSVMKQDADYRLHHDNGNVCEGEVVIVGKHDNAIHLVGMQSHDILREGSGVMIDGRPEALTAAHCSVNDSLFHEAKPEKLKFSSQIHSKECYREASCTNASVTANSVDNSGQETSGEFKNILQGTCEGQLVVSQGLNTPLCKEAQRGFPEGNNEQGQDENTAQRFLEEGDPEGCQTVLLPEEMEGRQSIQNICSGRGSENLLLTEQDLQEQKSKDDVQESSDLAEEDHSGFLHRTDAVEPQREQTPAVECGNQEILIDSVRTGIKHPEEETGATSEELRGGTEELLVELKTNDACDTYASEGDRQTQEVVTFTQETLQLCEDIMEEMAETSNLLDDFCKSGLVRQEGGTESTLLEENMAEIQVVGSNMEKSGHKDDAMVANTETECKKEDQILNLAVAGMSASNTEGGNSWAVQSKTRVTPKQQSPTTSNEPVPKSTAKDMTGISAAEMEKHMTMIYIEETSANNPQEVIDEQTIDPWTQTSLSQGSDGIKGQEGPEPRQRIHWKIDSLDGEVGEIRSDLTENEEQFVELSQSGASELRSGVETSSCTEQSNFLDDAPCGSGALKGERQLWTFNSTGLIQDTTANMSEPNDPEILFPEPISESLDILMEETVKEQHSHPTEAGVLNEGYVESQGDFSEESGPQSDAEITDDIGEAEKQILEEDTQSSTQMDTHVQVTEVSGDAPKDTVAISGGEVEEEEENEGPGPPRSPTMVPVEEITISTECGSLGGPESSRLLAGWSEDNVDTAAGLNRSQLQVSESVLDSSPQKSRIAVKNPRVRPPKDPRSLLHMPSLNPTPPSHPPAKIPVGFPVGVPGIGIKLPGFGGGLPVLKKTQPKIRDEVEPTPESKSDAPAEDEQHRKPKWMPPRQPGFGNPLMSELKTKLKKTARDNEL